MSLIHAVTRLRSIAERKWTTVWLVQYESGFAVLKQYREDATERYAREVRNGERVRQTGFTDMPVMLAHDDTERAILYEEYPDGDVWARLLTTRGAERDDCITRTLDAMEREAVAFQNPLLRELSFVGPDPYVCIHRLVKKAEDGDNRFLPLIALGREITTLPDSRICTRHDPELTNYLLAPDGRVSPCDLASFRCCHPFYLPAYALIHIAIAWRKTRNTEARAILGRFTQQARARLVQDTVTRRLWLMNLAEVFAYFVDWDLRQASGDQWHLHGLLATTKKFSETLK